MRLESPDTLRDVRIPVLVILGCEAVTKDPVRAVRFEKPETLRDVRIPVLVILGCEAVTKEPEMVFEPVRVP